MTTEMPCGVVLIRFTFDAMCAWIEARADEPSYKTCMAKDEQVARVRADAGLRFKPHGTRVRVVEVETN